MPAANVVEPVTVNAPLSVISPPVVTFNVPDTVEAPNTNALASTKITLFPLVIATVPKLFDA